MLCFRAALVLLAVSFLAQTLRAEDASKPLGEPVLEPSTLNCLGVYWVVGGDANKNARIEIEYRKAGSEEWKPGYLLFRVEQSAQDPSKHEDGKGSKASVQVPDGAWLFAGSVVNLTPGTDYELHLKLIDADGGAAEKTLTTRTAVEPITPKDMHVRHVAPGSGGGSGSEQDPYKGLAAANAVAKPGDLFIVHAGTYDAFETDKSGELGHPIIWRGEGAAVIDAKGKAPKAIAAGGIHDVWFEKLELCNAAYGIVTHDSERIVLRRCHIHGVEYGLAATRNTKGNMNGYFVTDNVIEGPSVWPRSKGIENARGIQVTGSGHVVAYNRIHGFGDALDTFPSVKCAAIDFHNNDISLCTDDGIEMDYSERNTRCFNNRFVNIFQGVSVQPVFGGPVYIFRNVLCNLGMEPFKMHNSPSGVLVMHNTVIKNGMPLVLYPGKKVRNSVYRNNLFLGTEANYAYECTGEMAGCDFDYDGFGGGPFKKVMKWSNTPYVTVDDLKAKSGVYKHIVMLDTPNIFASGFLPPADVAKEVDPSKLDLRLKPGTMAIDAGEALANFSDGFSGKAPDLGAYELGADAPFYGPRPEK